ncbi:MAG: HNH endonuclease [Deltaproteobacteria bacterium]|nr:HNH endonuclease [Deltaproteobacteria bacterium]
MNTLEQTLITKTGTDNGWECVLEKNSENISLASSRHNGNVDILSSRNGSGEYQVHFIQPVDREELLRGFPEGIEGDAQSFKVWSLQLLGTLLRRAAELLVALPNQPLEQYNILIDKELQDTPEISGTETERLVRTRIGQDLYRKALLSYWGGGCALTGIHTPQLLRASHAKPWAECQNDAERLNVYNGFLLAAHLDALFDTGLVTFTDSGTLLASPSLDKGDLACLHLDSPLHLRWIDEKHLPFLAWHRDKVFIRTI